MTGIPFLPPLVAAVALAPSVCAQTTWYVNAGASGTAGGQSWSDAFTHLQDAFAVATAGDRVWVASGVYVPGGTRSSTFLIPDGIELVGGFEGNETDAAQRNLGALPPTVLSGDVLGNDHHTPICQFIGECIQYGGNVLCTQGLCEGLRSTADNCFHVVTTTSCGPGTVIDGFIIEGGAANFWASGNVDGAGVYNGPGSPRFNRCTFRNNFAYNSGAAFFNGSGAPVLVDCQFVDNEAAYFSSGRGGGLFNATGHVTLERCLFFGNSAGLADTFLSGGQVGRGGGLHNGTGHVGLRDCQFIDNRSYRQGGGLYHGGGTLTMNGCTFYRNWSGNLGGGAMWLTGPAAVNSTLVADNISESIGGAAFVSGSAQLSGSVFENNRAIGHGGAIFATTSGTPLTIVDSVFLLNRSDGSGGAIYADGLPAVMEIRRSEFLENRAKSGGAVFNLRAGLRADHCRFSANVAAIHGGALEHRFGTARLRTCVFDGNRAARGGAIYSRTTPRIEHNTIVGNLAGESGGGLYHETGKAAIIGNLLWNNFAFGDPASSQLAIVDDMASVVYCNIQRGAETGYADANIDADPRFLNPLGPDGNAATYADNDYRITATSPCANRGDPMQPAFESDFIGVPRVIGCRADIGAFESDAPQAAGDFTGDGVIDLRDAAHWQSCFDGSSLPEGLLWTCVCVFDMDNSRTLELRDWALFLEQITGPRGR